VSPGAPAPAPRSVFDPLDTFVRRHLGSSPEEIEETLRAPGDPHERLDRTLAGEKMAGHLAKLRPETRDLLVMRYIDDLPIEHIAEATGKKKNAVYVALHRAVKELKQLCSGSTSDN